MSSQHTSAVAPRIVLATHNLKKLAELRAIVAKALPELDPACIVSAGELGLHDVVEDGTSFAENALIKARAAAEQSGLIGIADDSGIAVDILGGSPGIFSARWSGAHGDDAANNALLLAQLADIAPEHRGARFVCAAALVVPGSTAGPSREIVEIGEMPGTVLLKEQGSGGFGYDPLFQPKGHTVSAAELTAEEKNAISHRGTAFRALALHLATLLA